MGDERARSAKEQSDIKALLIVIATKLGANSKEIGACLGVDDSAIRHILRGTSFKRINRLKKKPVGNVVKNG